MKSLICIALIVALAYADAEACVRENCPKEVSACEKEVFGCALKALNCNNKCSGDPVCNSKCATDSGNAKLIALYIFCLKKKRMRQEILLRRDQLHPSLPRLRRYRLRQASSKRLPREERVQPSLVPQRLLRNKPRVLVPQGTLILLQDIQKYDIIII